MEQVLEMIAEAHWDKASKHVNSLAALAAQERGCTTPY